MHISFYWKNKLVQEIRAHPRINISNKVGLVKCGGTIDEPQKFKCLRRPVQGQTMINTLTVFQHQNTTETECPRNLSANKQNKSEEEIGRSTRKGCIYLTRQKNLWT